MIATLGVEMFRELKAKEVHKDVDYYGNPRVLLRLPCVDAAAGYLQSVRVVCPVTRRIYHLGTTPDVRTCQEAVAQSFGLKPHQYKPDRET